MRFLYITLLAFIIASCAQDEDIKNTGVNASADGNDQNGDRLNGSFETGEQKQVIASEGDNFGSFGNDGNGAAATLALKLVKADNSESEETASVTNAENFRIVWETSNARNCDLSAKLKSDDSPVSEISSSDSNGDLAVSRITSGHVIELNCEDSDGVSKSKTLDVAVEGGWLFVAMSVSVTNKVCSTFCENQGLESTASIEGAFCASGENLEPSALDVLEFPYGCFPGGNCATNTRGFALAQNTAHFCYGTGQTRDADPSDITVGCHCTTPAE